MDAHWNVHCSECRCYNSCGNLVLDCYEIRGDYMTHPKHSLPEGTTFLYGATEDMYYSDAGDFYYTIEKTVYTDKHIHIESEKRKCTLCKNQGYIVLPMDYYQCHDFLTKTDYSYKVCPLCQGRKIDVFSYPDSLEAKEYLVDYKVGKIC